ncbi:hypothetical protein [Bacillus pumilus]|uniref:hypothetical protein n=1 Tax=Bacillus pumilus TaxID=1408 RepID=UPI0011E8D684|nr:hypothetical protein [Bacillus pumilus]TYS30677.1 hypothetical protein FZC65_15045 [Bacillus pumilus]TYS43256.1 hypothetical protein FZC67_15005 [Bacillus pumilus]
MFKKVSILLVVVLIFSTILPSLNAMATAKESELKDHDFDPNNFLLIESEKNKTVFNVIEDDNEIYEYEVITKNPDKENEKIQVNKYSIKNSKRNELIESTEELVNSKPSLSTRASCKGKNGTQISWAGTRATLYLDSCTTKKIVNIIEGGYGSTGAIASIAGALKAAGKFAKFVPYIGAISGILFFAGSAIKLISGNGKYGIGYHMVRNPLTGDIYHANGIPWRQ